MQSEKETSQITSQLDSRISTNMKFGSVDLDEWLLGKLDIKKGQNVLDVGCGTGNHLIRIAEMFPQGNYYGIDISAGSIEEAKKKSGQKNLKIKFMSGDAFEAATLQDSFFDMIISVYALYYVKEPQKILSVLKSKLAKGGSIAVMSPYKRNNEEWYNFLSSFMKIPGEIESVANNFMDTQVIPFAKSNFNNLATFNFENKIKIPSFNDLEKYWKSNIYHKEELDSDFRKAAFEYFRKNASFTITKRALLAVMS